MAIERHISTLPPAQPSYILRGHASQIHSVHFLRQNSRLLTGDADGWVVYWKVETKRALAVWKAHHGAILGTAEWGREKIITHGRDNTLRIWQLRASDEPTLSTILPAEPAQEERPKPWLLHTLPVNTLNFCAFSMCYEHHAVRDHQHLDVASSTEAFPSMPSSNESILIAVPARDDKKIELYQYPDEKLKFLVPRAQSTDTGMVMAVKLVHHLASRNILVLAGYEGGLTAVHKLPQNNHGSALEPAQLVYLSQPHTQPVLSLDASPDAKMYFTSSADALLAAHRVPEVLPDVEKQVDDFSGFGEGNSRSPPRQSSSEDQHSGNGKEQNSDDPSPGPISTQSSPTSVQNVKDSEEPSHTASESFDVSKNPSPAASVSSSLSFAKQPMLHPATHLPQSAGLSSLLSSAGPQSKAKFHLPPPPAVVTVQPPHRTMDTKHAGQQSLRVRSDGRLLVTGGWDTRIRIYSTKTLKEVAVLKWHKEGVYAVAFSEILSAEDLRRGENEDDPRSQGQDLMKRQTGLGKLQRQREEQTQLKHWVVAGAKDGKVSLWEVF